jgi:hypothetical protein
MGAARVVEVLTRTGGFSVSVARHRLFETTQHILECTQSIPSIQPGGDGFASSLRVRLLHASVRRRILDLTTTHPNYYNIAQNGIPINDLDSIATIGTFSATLLYLSLPRQGIFVSRREEEDYIALWRLIAHYTGTPTSPFSTPQRAKIVMESLLMNEINPTPTSRILARNIITALHDTPPTHASREFLEASARWLNGNELCDALGLGRPGVYYWALVAGQCLFFMSVTYFYRAFPGLDRRKIELLKDVFWKVIVEGKYGLGGDKAVFEMRYRPEIGLLTEVGEKVDGGGKGEGDGNGKIGGPGEVGVSVERRSLRTLGMVLCTFGLGTWLAFRIAREVVAWAW